MKKIEKLKENGVKESKFFDMDIKEMYDKLNEIIDVVNEWIQLGNLPPLIDIIMALEKKKNFKPSGKVVGNVNINIDKVKREAEMKLTEETGKAMDKAWGNDKGVKKCQTRKK